MSRFRALATFGLVLSLSWSPASAADRPPILPQDCEVALALSAAPEHLQAEAAVYALREDGYVQVRDGANGFTCIVNRDRPRSLKPTCFDAEGGRTIVPKIVAVGRYLLEGVPANEIRERIEAGFSDGTFEPPARPGVAYMLSHFNRPQDPTTGRLGWFPPHVMYYAPGLTHQDIGSSPSTWQTSPTLPFIGYQGPHGFMISRAEVTGRPEEHLISACPAWVGGRAAELPPEARQFDFWIGTWDVNLRILQQDLSWQDSVQAEARIYPILEGKAVLELWESEPIRGFSLRYFDVDQGHWVLWLNWPGPGRSSSGILDGTFRHGRGDFYRTDTNAEGQESTRRYTFTDITPTSLRWNDGFSTDGGRTWREDWIMEFSRTGPAPSLPPEGGPAHTFQGGTLCPAEPFRTFERLAGRHSGQVSWQEEGGSWSEAPAELVGYRINGGCAVLSLLRSQRNGAPWEVFSLHTWNTGLRQYEESRLDSVATSALEVFYGAQQEGTVQLLRSDVNGAEEGTSRRRWSFPEDGLLLEAQVPGAEEGSWADTFRAELRREETADGG